MMRSLLLLLSLILVYPVVAQPAEDAVPEVTDFTTGIPLYEDALNFAVPLARKLLAEQESFIPFGLALTREGFTVPVQVLPEGKTEPEVAATTMMTLRQFASEGIKLEGKEPMSMAVAAICADILTMVPGRPNKTDAIAVFLENGGESSTVYVLPYIQKDDGSVEYLEGFFREQAPTIFVNDN